MLPAQPIEAFSEDIVLISAVSEHDSNEAALENLQEPLQGIRLRNRSCSRNDCPGHGHTSVGIAAESVMCCVS